MFAGANDRSYIYKIDLNLQDKNDARIIAYDFIEDKSTVLDVGCACGDFGVLVSREKQCRVYGMEYDRASIKIAEETKVFTNLHEVDLNTFDIEEYKGYCDFFDYITLLDVLEHTINPDQVLLKMKKFLKRNGFFIISLPNISFGEIKINILKDDFTYTDMGILDRTHLKFFTYKTIIHFFTTLNLEICQSNVKVFDFSTNNNVVPFYIKKYIENNPHSYVYQYVMKVTPSDLCHVELFDLNSKRMQIEWTTIKQQLKVNRKFKWANKLLPEGSKRRLLAREVYNRIF